MEKRHRAPQGAPLEQLHENGGDDDGRDGDDGRKKTYGGCKWRIPALAT